MDGEQARRATKLGKERISTRKEEGREGGAEERRNETHGIQRGVTRLSVNFRRFFSLSLLSFFFGTHANASTRHRSGIERHLFLVCTYFPFLILNYLVNYISDADFI